MYLPGKLDISIYRGDSFELTLEFRTPASAAIDLTGRTYLAQIRPTTESAASVTFTIDTTGLATGDLILSLTAAQTAALTKDGVWDIEETEGARVTTLLAGQAMLVKDVSRA